MLRIVPLCAICVIILILESEKQSGGKLHHVNYHYFYSCRFSLYHARQPKIIESLSIHGLVQTQTILLQLGGYRMNRISFLMADGFRYISQHNVKLGGYTTIQPKTTYHTGTVSTYGTYGSTYNYQGTSTTYVEKKLQKLIFHSHVEQYSPQTQTTTLPVYDTEGTTVLHMLLQKLKMRLKRYQLIISLKKVDLLNRTTWKYLFFRTTYLSIQNRV